MESTAVADRCDLDRIDDTIPSENRTLMLGCRHCRIVSCPFTDGSECPVNILWEKSERLKDKELEQLFSIKADNATKPLK